MLARTFFQDCVTNSIGPKYINSTTKLNRALPNFLVPRPHCCSTHRQHLKLAFIKSKKNEISTNLNSTSSCKYSYCERVVAMSRELRDTDISPFIATSADLYTQKRHSGFSLSRGALQKQRCAVKKAWSHRDSNRAPQASTLPFYP